MNTFIYGFAIFSVLLLLVVSFINVFVEKKDIKNNRFLFYLSIILLIILVIQKFI